MILNTEYSIFISIILLICKYKNHHINQHAAYPNLLLDCEGTTFVLQQLAAGSDTLFSCPEVRLTSTQLSSACIPFKDPKVVMLLNEII